MAFKIGYAPENDSCLWNLCAGAGDPNRCIIPAGDYTNWYPLDQLFLMNAGEIFFQPGRVGQWLHIDVYMQEAFLVRDFKVKRTAGERGKIGYRTGAGPQAILGVGGLQGAYSMAVDSQGRFVFPSARANRISRLTVDAAGNSNLEAVRINYSPPNPALTPKQQEELWYGYWANSLIVDAQDNMWTSTGKTITKIAPNGQISSWQTPFGNVLQIINIHNDYLLCMTRNNSWDICFKFVKATGESVRLAGMDDAEVAAYQAQNGRILVDGPAINGATFHSAIICAALILPDGSLIVGFCNGDERQYRLLKDGRVSSLITDCTFRETQIRLGHTNNGGPEPQYLTSVSGMNAAGFPQYRMPVFYEPSGTGVRAVGRIVKVEDTSPPPPVGGTMEGTLDGVNDKREAYGWARDPSNLAVVQTVNIKIDDADVGSIGADTASADVGNHRFFWPIPDKFKDGNQHALAAFVGPFQLWSSPKTFTIPAQTGGTVGQINVVFQRGDFSAPAGTVVTKIKTELLNSANVVVMTHPDLAGSAAGDSFANVPVGNGYKVRMTTLDQNGAVLGAPALSNTVDVAATAPGPVTVQIVLGGTATS